MILLFAAPSFSQDAMPAAQGNKGLELTQREQAVRRDEERLKALRKEVDEKLERYGDLLKKVEDALRKLETARDERTILLARAYEAMTAEEAASRLSALDEATAVHILVQMKSKKAGAAMGSMEPKKAASLTEHISKIVKKIPAK